MSCFINNPINTKCCNILSSHSTVECSNTSLTNNLALQDWIETDFIVETSEFEYDFGKHLFFADSSHLLCLFDDEINFTSSLCG